MNKLSAILKNIPYLVVSVLVGILILQREFYSCNPVPQNDTTLHTVTQYSTHIDTFYYPYIIPKPYPAYRDTGSTRILKLPADTAFIIRDYLARNIYKRVLVNDSNAHILLIDTVTKNQLTQGTLQAEFYAHTNTITQTRYITSPLKRKLFLGVGIGLNPQQIGLTPSLMYGTKADHFYSVGYDVINSNISFSIWWKIKINKL